MLKNNREYLYQVLFVYILLIIAFVFTCISNLNLIYLTNRLLFDFLLKILITSISIYYIFKTSLRVYIIRDKLNIKISLYLLIFCILSFFINKNNDSILNNIYFDVHLSLFFYLAIINNLNEYNYENLKIFIFIVLHSYVSIISLITIIILNGLNQYIKEYSIEYMNYERNLKTIEV